MKQAKPIIHGRDHALGGADPVPGLGGLQFNSGTYGPHNLGDWLDVHTTDEFATGDTTFGQSNAGIWIDAAKDLWLSTAEFMYFSTTGASGIVIQSGYPATTETDGFVDIYVYGTGNLGMLFSTDGTGNYGIDLLAKGDNNAGVSIQTVDANNLGIAIQAAGVGNGGIDIQTLGSEIFIDTSSNPGLWLTSTNQLIVFTDGGPIILNSNWGTTEDTVQARVTTGNFFCVAQASSDGSIPFNPTLYMRVGTDGVLHLPSNGSVVYDLAAV